ncbi:MAG: hypothetical protein B6I24_03275 [Bacteroidetes bacterium 4572_128]|nr:MAG: hypothetical protein B6I24_03275 [Bacteroidetes bacterium 4572_128]
MVKKYFSNLEDKISLFQNIINEYSITKKYYNNYKAYISGSIIFKNNSKLFFTEVKDTEFYRKDKYSYHYMNSENELIFRYDNAYHHPEIKTFPHHKHTKNAIEESSEPEIDNILFEIKTQNQL